MEAALTLVTGGSGFVGRILVRRLLDEGRRVRVLERRPGDAFAGLALERVAGDVGDAASLAAAMEGVDVLFHAAGVVSHLESERARLLLVNVRGVENALAAARAAGVRRVVHVSSVAAVGMAPGPHERLDEDAPYPEQARRFPYSLSKRLGEEAALTAAREGQDVVVACPTFVIGAGDVNRVSTHPVEQYLRGALRFTLPGGLTYVDVRDVVEGLLLVERSGETGRRYVLGGDDGCLSHREFFALVGEIGGRRRSVHLPAGLLVPSARLLDRLHVPLPIPPDELDGSRYYWYATSARAQREFGYAPRPVREAVESTVRWYRDGGGSE